MDHKFKILWLDDEFVNEEGTANLPLPLIRLRYPELEIKTVAFVDKCESELTSNASDYHAVILDANGKYSISPNKEANKLGFEDLIYLAKEQHIPTYVFSGQLSPKESGDQADITLRNLRRNGFAEDINLFYKSGTYKLLLDRVLSDLKSDFALLYDYPELLENVLKYNIDKGILCKVLAWQKTKEDKFFPGYLNLRGIVVDYIWNSIFKPFIGCTEKDPDYKEIEPFCMENWEQETLKAFKNLANKGVHDGADSPYMREIVINSFLVIMLWYNKFMHKTESEKNPKRYYKSARIKEEAISESKPDITENSAILEAENEGIVQKDRNGFYYVGSYVIDNKFAWKYEGKKVRVIKHTFFPYKKLAFAIEEMP